MRNISFVLFAAACWAFFQLCYPYHFFYKEQNQLFLWDDAYLVPHFQRVGGIAQLIGDGLTQFYYYLYAGATILTLVLLLLGWLTWRLLRAVGIPPVVVCATALAVMTAEAVFHLRYNFPLSATVAAAGWAATLWLCASWMRRLTTRKRSTRPLLVLPLLLLPAAAYWIFGVPRIGRLSAPNFQLERMLAVDNEYYFGHHDRVLALVESDPQPPQEMKFFYNLVQAQRGQLPDHLLRFPQTELGTFHRIGPDTPLYTIKNMNELYWVLGDMTFTERAAMMACVFSPQNRNVRMIKRLAETSLVSGDTLAANKYLRLLDKTVAYRRWARDVRRQLPAVYRQKRLLVNRQDTIATTDNAHFLMMQLLDSNPDNLAALDYILCSTLLLKDIESFKRDYDRYCTDGTAAASRCRQTTLYQEALCIYLAGTSAPPEVWQHYISRPDVAQRFRQYNQQRGSTRFRDTYWYYFDTAKTPEQP